jgi:two-component system NarL family response regulator
MPGLNGLEALKAIRVHDPAAKAVILTSYEGEEDIYQALVAGARAYLLKESPPLTIIECIIAVAAGRKYLPASVAATLAGRFDSNTLSHREMEVLRLLAEGKSNKVISRMIGIAEGTIKFHLNNIFGKLGVTSRTAAIASAVKRGLVRI